jgi:hypothetical protein
MYPLPGLLSTGILEKDSWLEQFRPIINSNFKVFLLEERLHIKIPYKLAMALE